MMEVYGIQCKESGLELLPEALLQHRLEALKKIIKIFVYILYPLFMVSQLWERCKMFFIQEQQKRKLHECGSNVYIGRHCTLTEKNISVGNDVSIGDECNFATTLAHIYIGNKVSFGPRVSIRGGNHRIDIIGKYMKDVTEKEKLPDNDQDVVIEDDVWVGTNVTILKGVKIGRGSVIGAGSVVARSVPPYTIHIGTHGILEKERFTKTQIEEHESVLENRIHK